MYMSKEDKIVCPDCRKEYPDEDGRNFCTNPDCDRKKPLPSRESMPGRYDRIRDRYSSKVKEQTRTSHRRNVVP